MERRLSVLLVVFCLWPAAALSKPINTSQLRQEREKVKKVLQTLRQGGELFVEWPANRSRPALIRGLLLSAPPRTDQEKARWFLKSYPALLAGESSAFKFIETQRTRDQRVVLLQQTYQGIPVEGGQVAVTLDNAGRIRALSSEVEPVRLSTIQPKITPSAAIQTTVSKVHGANGLSRRTLDRWDRSSVALIILNDGPSRLAYKIFLQGDLSGRFHLIDAHTGQYLGWRQGAIIESEATRREVRP
jgi:Zn-dependent metalloprotease